MKQVFEFSFDERKQKLVETIELPGNFDIHFFHGISHSEVLERLENPGKYFDNVTVEKSERGNVRVEVQLEPQRPPKILKISAEIRTYDVMGISPWLPEHNQYVGLSTKVVGDRNSAEVWIDAQKMYKDGIEFYKCQNGFWMTKYVDPKYMIEVHLDKFFSHDPSFPVGGVSEEVDGQIIWKRTREVTEEEWREQKKARLDYVLKNRDAYGSLIEDGDIDGWKSIENLKVALGLTKGEIIEFAQENKDYVLSSDKSEIRCKGEELWRNCKEAPVLPDILYYRTTEEKYKEIMEKGLLLGDRSAIGLYARVGQAMQCYPDTVVLKIDAKSMIRDGIKFVVYYGYYGIHACSDIDPKYIVGSYHSRERLTRGLIHYFWPNTRMKKEREKTHGYYWEKG